MTENSMTGKRILIVSDSLGTPIHARGIFNFTCSAVQIFRNLGLRTTLLLEPPTEGVLAQLTHTDLDRSESFGTKYAIIADIIKHFEGDRFRFSWDYLDPNFQRLSREHPAVADFCLALNDTKAVERQIHVRFPYDLVKEYGFTMQSEHLKLFESFLLVDHIYAESFRRANLGLRPPVIDASDFDYVYVDTPHYLTIHGVSPENIACVVHDFIPFFDTSMGFDWRQLFVRKMEQSLRVARNLVFNSETTRRYFEQIYTTNWPSRQVIIYPPNRMEIEKAAVAERLQKSNYIRDIQSNKVAEQAEWACRIGERPGKAKFARRIISNAPKWDPDLPFFCSILSDEPRKNIAAIVDASTKFIDKANFLIMGQINGNRYMSDRPENFPNLHFTGYVSDVQKFDLLRSCAGFIFPSLSEGFGIPIVEAMMFGAPVICVDTEVFREITFDKALYFGPGDQQTLERQIQALLDNPGYNDLGLTLKKQSEAMFSQSAMAERAKSLFAI